MTEYENLAVKIFSENCCKDCSIKTNGTKTNPQYESNPMYLKDNMGRDILWDNV
jgi:hypothetical protein